MVAAPSPTTLPIRQAEATLKRALDVSGALLGLAVGWPVLLLSAVAIRLTSPGPALHWQRRCGLGGRCFAMPKLRTMVVDAEGRLPELRDRNEIDGPAFKLRHDPRVTQVGRVLRRHSLDELPQLWCVLRGDMSLVGPRPPLPDEVARYDARQRRRLSVKPGITCLWQVRRGREHLSFDQWLRLDEEYIESRSLARDVRILLATIPVVLRGDNV